VRRFSLHRLYSVGLILCGAMLACSVPFMSAAPPTSVLTATPTDPPYTGAPPQISIDGPAANSQAIVNQPLRIRAHATDGAGITRIEMHESGRIVAAQSTVTPSKDFVALLEYRPTQTGNVTLDVVAYRNGIASDPAAITIGIVASVAQLANPLDPTLNAAAGPICTGKTTVSGLAMHIAPGTASKLIATLSAGETLNVSARSSDSRWYLVRRQSGVTGWVSAAYLKLDGDCSTAPVSAATVAAP